MVEEITQSGAALTQRRLLLAAEKLVVLEGVRSLTVRRIAGEADVNSALIRYHFGSTDGLLHELAERNAGQIRDARETLLGPLEADGEPNFQGSVDALILPLWAPAAMSSDHRALIVLHEIFSRASPELHEEVWGEFSDGMTRLFGVLQRALGGVDRAELAWRVRFVTAAALDIPPRSARYSKSPLNNVYGDTSPDERIAQFRRFAYQALRAI